VSEEAGLKVGGGGGLLVILLNSGWGHTGKGGENGACFNWARANLRDDGLSEF